MEVLSDLFNYADFIASFHNSRWKSYDQFLATRNRAERKRRSEMLQRLKRRRLIRVRKTAHHLEIALTQAGRLEAIRISLGKKQTKLPSGESCLIIFDFPESARRARNAFRRFIKTCGFSLLQQSVWESRYDVFDEVHAFIRVAKIASWVTVIAAKKRSAAVRIT
jgi:DNA-binding transcriptional regulator PaaX